MKRYLALPIGLGALLAMSGAAAATPTCSPGQTAGTAPLYCIPAVPPPPPATPAAAVAATSSVVVHDLSVLTPAALLGKGNVEFSASASGPGTFTILVKTTLHGKTVIVGSARKTVGSAGATVLGLSLTRAGRAVLKHRKGSLKLVLSTTFKPAKGKAATLKSAVILK
jgi:hypothetical protein